MNIKSLTKEKNFNIIIIEKREKEKKEMSKISYANLKLKTKSDVLTFDFNGEQVEVLQYLPISDKYDLIMITLQKAKEGNIYNQLKLDMFFHLHLVYLYTNLSFTDKQRENEFKIYDTLQSNGFINKMLELIPKEEYNELFEMVEKQVKMEMKYTTTAASILSKFVDDLPRNAEAAMKIVDNFDPDKFQAVKDFAKAANGGRDI